MFSLIEKFVFSSLGILASIAANFLFATYVGPEGYGTYGFIIAAGTFITQIIFVTLNETYVFNLSNSRYSLASVNATYSIFFIIVALLCFLLLTITLISPTLKQVVWPNVTVSTYLFLGLGYTLLLNAQQSIVKFADCTGKHAQVERLRLASKIIVLPLMGLLIFTHLLTLTTYLFLLIFSFVFFYFVFFRYYSFPLVHYDKKNFKQLLKATYQGWGLFSVYPFLDALYAYYGRYVLQSTGGDMEQGFFTYAFFLAMTPISVLTPMMTLYMSHMSTLYSKASERLKGDYLKIYRLSLFIYGIFCFFLFNHAGDILIFLGNKDFYNAAPTLKWLAIFSFLNLFGLLSGNLFFCTERIAYFRLITNVKNFIGIPLLFFLCTIHKMSALTLAITLSTIYGIKVLFLFIANIHFLKIDLTEFNCYFVFPFLGLITLSFLFHVMNVNFLSEIIITVIMTIISVLINYRILAKTSY